MRHLIYFTVGVSPDYINLTYWCIYSMLYNGLTLDNIDILIMCDEEYEQYVRAKFPSWIKIHITDKNPTSVITSMRKLEIFKYKDISNYDHILYLDSDIMVLENISELFEKTLCPEFLYVKQEGNNHTNRMHSLIPYTEEELLYLSKNNIYVFSCGHFMFKNTSIMKEHFDAILDLIKNYSGPYFYEQSFMNYYFNLKNLTNIFLLEPYIDYYRSIYNTCLECVKNPNASIIHFANYEMKSQEKLHNMKVFFHYKEFKMRYHSIYALVNHLPLAVKIADKNSKIAFINLKENKNELVRSCLSRYNPYMAYLMNCCFEYNEKASLNTVMLNGGLSSFCQDNRLDFIFIEDGTKADFELAYKKIKPNGWLCGSPLDDPIKEFCFDNCLRINSIFENQKYFAIKIIKLV